MRSTALLMALMALTVSPAAAKGGKNAMTTTEETCDPSNSHTCDCFQCKDVTEEDDGTLTITVGHCKQGSISWMCCVGIDGGVGNCDGAPGSGEVVGPCGAGPKCETIPQGQGLVINVPAGTETFTVNTHDGKTAGDSLNVGSVCGGPPKGQGGSCVNEAMGVTAHCLIDFSIKDDCGYVPNTPIVLPEIKEPVVLPAVPEEPKIEVDPVAPEEPKIEVDPVAPEEPKIKPAEPAPAPEEVNPDPEATPPRGSADETCDAKYKVGPGNGGDYRCCAGFYNGGLSFGECETSSCVENFDGKNLNCFNYGSPQHPVSDKLSTKKKGGSNQCPYVEADRAICDTSFYTNLNGKNCREGGKNHCLGKVKCMTNGVNVPKNGNSDGTASGGGACVSLEFPEGTDCFYNGNSENWKVCGGTPVKEAEEPEPVDEEETVVVCKAQKSGKAYQTNYLTKSQVDKFMAKYPSVLPGDEVKMDGKTYVAGFDCDLLLLEEEPEPAEEPQCKSDVQCPQPACAPGTKYCPVYKCKGGQCVPEDPTDDGECQFDFQCPQPRCAAGFPCPTYKCQDKTCVAVYPEPAPAPEPATTEECNKEIACPQPACFRAPCPSFVCKGGQCVAEYPETEPAEEPECQTDLQCPQPRCMAGAPCPVFVCTDGECVATYPEVEPLPAPVPAPVPSPEEVEIKTTTTVGSGSGDPHFKTWTGHKYDYHGECDLVLVDNPSFADGLGLRVHIRTTRVKYFSFIEKVAVQIGKDVLEFDNDVENFFVNGEKAETNKKHHKTHLAGFIVRRDARALSIRVHDNGSMDRHSKMVAKIDLHTRKNGFPAVIVDGGKTAAFKGSLGLLGEWGTGKMMARDGETEMSEDPNAFALEWQVRDTEPMLFKEARFPQFPNVCTPPATQPQRLGASSFQQEAEEACSHWKVDKEDCIFDVIATRDILVAEEGHIVHIE